MIYTFTFPSGQKCRYKADLAKASAPICYEGEPGQWIATSFVTSDAFHRVSGLAEIVLRIEKASDESHELDDVTVDDLRIRTERETST